jgi:hypothetical protein
LHLCRYFTVDRRKCQWQSGFGSRSTADEMLCKQPVREAILGQGADAGACHTGFPDQANKFPNVPI